MTAIKPCPHCGHVPVYPASFRLTDGYKWGGIVCGCTQVRTSYEPVEQWAEDAIQEWNQRVKEVISTKSDERCPVKE